MKSVQFAQNFLQNDRTAKRLLELAEGPCDAVWVDLGAGRGIITEAIASKGLQTVAVEKDPRLVRHLRQRFAGVASVTVQAGDLLAVPIPRDPFVCVGNPPFNVSTQLVRRWCAAAGFQSAALIVEREFGGRVSGEYGTTKLSASLGALFTMTVPMRLDRDEFRPQPRVNVAILRVLRRAEPLVPWDERDAFWSLVNCLFEQGPPTLGMSMKKLGASTLPRQLRDKPMRDAGPDTFAQIYTHLRVHADPALWKRVSEFNHMLPPKRRPLTAVP